MFLNIYVYFISNSRFKINILINLICNIFTYTSRNITSILIVITYYIFDYESYMILERIELYIFELSKKSKKKNITFHFLINSLFFLFYIVWFKISLFLFLCANFKINPFILSESICVFIVVEVIYIYFL